MLKKLFLRKKISSAKKALGLALRVNRGDMAAALWLRMSGAPIPVPSHYIGNLRRKIAELEKKL